MYVITYKVWPRDWDATTYERLSRPLAADGPRRPRPAGARGRRARARRGLRHRQASPPRCSSACPRAGVAVDAAPAMVEEARQQLRDSVECSPADLLELRVERPSTRSSRPRRSTGSPTTTACSRASSTPSSPAAGWSPSAAARATSRRSRAPASLWRADHPSPSTSPTGPGRLALRVPRGHRGAPAQARLHRRVVLAQRGPGRARGPAGTSARSCCGSHPRASPRSTPRGLRRAGRGRAAGPARRSSTCG